MRGDIILENTSVRYVIGADGRNLNFIDKRTGKDYCVQESKHYFLSLRKQGTDYQPSACAFARGKISIEFESAQVMVDLGVSIHDHYFTIEVLSVAGEGVEAITLSDLRLNNMNHVGMLPNVARNDEFAVGVMALNIQVNAEQRPPQSAWFWSGCYSKTEMVGAKFAIIGCPTRRLRSVIKRMVKQEGLVHSKVGGAWAMDAKENKYSYMFADVTEANVDEWIAVAKTAGIKELLLYGWGNFGHYDPKPDKFPNGLAGMKAVVNKIHAANLKAGWHMNSFLIAKNDRWVTPVPDKRLAKRTTLTLAAPLAADAAFIPTVESPKDLPTQTDYWLRGGKDILVGDEIITYTGLETQPPYGLTGCCRGMHETKATAHAQGAALYNLQEAVGMYLPDADLTLLDDMAQRIADLVNTCGFDLIYFDALEIADLFAGMQWRWHYAPKFALNVFNRIRGRVQVEASTWLHHLWHIHSRLGAWDHPVRDPKQFLDSHLREIAFYSDNLLPGQLGWWTLRPYAYPNDSRTPFRTYSAPLMFTPDVVEYLCVKCIGHDIPFSLQNVLLAEGRQHPVWNNRLSIMGRYEGLRLSQTFTKSVKERLQVPGDEFGLAQNSAGEWQLQPVAYTEHKVTALDGLSNTWVVRNTFGPQPARFRIQALRSAGSYTAPDSLLLADFVDTSEFATRYAAPGLNVQLNSTTQESPAGNVSGCLVVTNTSATRSDGCWAMVGKEFTPVLNMAKCPALGVWVFGDAQGEVLNLQLVDYRGRLVANRRDAPALAEHYIIIDFMGWRYFELIEPEGKRWSNYDWPYKNIYAVYREDVDLSQLKWLNLYANNVPPGKTITCYVSPIQAMTLQDITLKNPSVTIGRQTIVFPVALESGYYLEFNSLTDCKLYDPNGKLIQEVKPAGKILTLAPGENEITFACDALRDYNARAMVTTITAGSPLTN